MLALITDEDRITRSIGFSPPLTLVREGEVDEAETDDWRSAPKDHMLRWVLNTLDDESGWERWSALAWPLLRAGAWSSIWRLRRLPFEIELTSRVPEVIEPG